MNTNTNIPREAAESACLALTRYDTRKGIYDYVTSNVLEWARVRVWPLTPWYTGEYER